MAKIQYSLISGEAGEFAATRGLPVGLLYNDGKIIYKKPVSAFRARIPNARITAVIAALSAIWTLRNTGGTNTLVVKAILISSSFDGTAAATTQQFQLQRFSGATPTGGTALLGIAEGGDIIPSIDARFNYAAALSITGTTFEEAFHEIGVQRQVSAGRSDPLQADPSTRRAIIRLTPGQGLGIRLGVASVIGDGLGGSVWLEEYDPADL